jgi:hypothetical protein
MTVPTVPRFTGAKKAIFVNNIKARGVNRAVNPFAGPSGLGAGGSRADPQSRRASQQADEGERLEADRDSPSSCRTLRC